MEVVKINNHVQQALNRFMQQYRGFPVFAALMTAFVQQVQEAEDAAYATCGAQQLWNGTTYPSVGAQLDGIGEIVGQERDGLDDSEYLIFILGKIAENYSDTTIPTLLSIAVLLFQATYPQMLQLFPASVAFQVSSDALLPANLYTAVANILQNSVGGGISVGFISGFDTDNAFTMGDDLGNGDGGGFGDDLDPTAGGEFAYDLYTNSGG